jgi:thiamine biosynthesis lipoprotein
MIGHPVYRIAHEAMGTVFEALIAGTDEAYAIQAAQAAFAEVDRIERLFNRFEPGSEISQVNRVRAGETMVIGVETYECLLHAEKVCRETSGAFNVQFGASVALPNLEFYRNQNGFAVRILAGSACIDLGGIGKGYALDRAAILLADWGIGCALIHGGTSTALAVGGEWPVLTGGDVDRPFRLRAGALSGSGTEVKGDHIIDTRTGRPVRGRLGAWAYHLEATEADALSTAFMVMEPESVEGYCRCHPSVWARLLDEQGRSRTFNSHLENHFESRSLT